MSTWKDVYADDDAYDIQQLRDEVTALRAKVEAVRNFAKRIEALEFPTPRLCARELRKVLGDTESEP